MLDVSWASHRRQHSGWVARRSGNNHEMQLFDCVRRDGLRSGWQLNSQDAARTEARYRV